MTQQTDAQQNPMDIDRMATEVHATAVSKDWWDPTKPREFGTLMALVHSEASEAVMEYANSGSITAKRYKIDANRVSEIRSDQLYDDLAISGLKKLRKQLGYLKDPGDEFRYEPMLPSEDELAALAAYGLVKPEGVPVELADIIIRVLDIAEAYNIPIGDVLLEKMAYNKTRPSRHGGKTI